MKANIRFWATPLVIGAFVITAATGLLLFFDYKGGLVKPVHEWLSWLLVAGAAFHILANWKTFTGYFAKKGAVAIISLGVVVTVLSSMPFLGGKGHGEGGKRVAMASVRALESSSLATVALVVQQQPEELVAGLRQNGIAVVSPSQTIVQIAAANGKKAPEVLGVLMAKPADDHDDDDH